MRPTAVSVSKSAEADSTDIGELQSGQRLQIVGEIAEALHLFVMHRDELHGDQKPLDFFHRVFQGLLREPVARVGA